MIETGLIKFTDILAGLASVFSLAAILISLLVLLEIQKQRRESYKPWLFIKNKNFYLQRNPNGTPCFLKDVSDEIEDLYGNTYDLEFHNVGLAAAHTIHIRWGYNLDRLEGEFDRLGVETGILKKAGDGHFEYIFETKTQHGYGFTINPPKEEQIELAFLRSGDVVNIRIPETIKNYLTFVPYLELLSSQMPYRVDLRNEEFTVTFEFFDISGKKHIQKLRILIVTFAYEKETHDKNYGVGSMSFSKS
ncbi:hypothetical protein ES703_78227 [subsurface metagenome]